MNNVYKQTMNNMINLLRDSLIKSISHKLSMTILIHYKFTFLLTIDALLTSLLFLGGR